MKKIVLFLSMMLITVACFAKDIKTLVVTTSPQMHCANCENKIKNNLRFEKGVKSIETSIGSQTVTIVYDADKTTEDELIAAFQKFNYAARKVCEGEKVERNEGEECKNM